MKASTIVREPTLSDVDAIADLRLVLEHGRHERQVCSPGFYIWKYFQNPVHPSCVRIAEDGGKLVGLVAATFKKLKIGGDTFVCGELGDFLTHPDYRRQGIFTRLVEDVCSCSVAEGARVFYVRPNDNSFPGLVRMGFEECFRLTPMISVLNISNILRRRISNRLLLSLSRPIAAAVARLLTTRTSQPAPADVEISRVCRFGKDIDDLWGRVASRHPTAVVRDEVYLNWRYADNPRGYTIDLARRGRSSVGYVVVNQEPTHTGLQCGYLLDLLAEGVHPGVANALISTALHRLRGSGADIVFTWVLRGGDLHRALRRSGFLPFGRDLHFVVRTHELSPDHEATLKDRASWYFAMGETDGV